MRLETLAVHAGRDDFGILGVHAPPLDLSTTYPVHDLAEASASLEAMAAGEPPRGNPIYARLHNPTVARFEQALARLEGADGAVAFGSGMAALTACLLAARQDGTHVVGIRPMYGSSDHLLGCGMLGLTVTWATPATLAAAIRPDTALVVIETPANPTAALLDIAAVVQRTGRVPVVVDSTFATPVLQQPLRHGAAMVLHSATKFLGGHGDVIAGVVAAADPWLNRLRQVRLLTGALLHPLAGYLLHRGLPTLPLRVERAQASAQVLAARLAEHPAVARVHYPGLPGGDPAGLIGRQMAGPGSVFAFELAGDLEASDRFLADLSLLTHAVSLGSTDTLIQRPAALTHHIVPAADREAAGIGTGLIRVSVGLEHPDDLWNDLVRALGSGRQAGGAGRASIRRSAGGRRRPTTAGSR